MPRCRDLAIFVVKTDGQTDRQTNRLLYPCACARGNYNDRQSVYLLFPVPGWHAVLGGPGEQEWDGRGEGVEVLVNEPREHDKYGKGQYYTHGILCTFNLCAWCVLWWTVLCPNLVPCTMRPIHIHGHVWLYKYMYKGSMHKRIINHAVCLLIGLHFPVHAWSMIAKAIHVVTTVIVWILVWYCFHILYT